MPYISLIKKQRINQTNKDIKIWMTEPPYSFIYQIPSESYRPALYFDPDTDSLLVGDYTLLYINNLKQTVTTIKDVIQYKKGASIYKVKENSFLIGSSQLSYVKDISKPTMEIKIYNTDDNIVTSFMPLRDGNLLIAVDDMEPWFIS